MFGHPREASDAYHLMLPRPVSAVGVSIRAVEGLDKVGRDAGVNVRDNRPLGDIYSRLTLLRNRSILLVWQNKNPFTLPRPLRVWKAPKVSTSIAGTTTAPIGVTTVASRPLFTH